MHMLESVDELLDILEYGHTWWRVCSPHEVPGDKIIFKGVPSGVNLDAWIEE